MGRDTSNAAMANSNSAQGLSKTYSANAGANSNILTPTLNQMATNPLGFGQQTKNDMNTAALQSAGGAAAGIVGQENLQAARTNNAGAFAPAAAQAGHDATTQLSDAALNVQNKDAILKQTQQQEGLQGLQNMYNTNVGAGENALGLSNNALSVKNAADEQTFNQWYKPFATVVGGGAQVRSAALMGCWIAEAVYGVDDVRTHKVRAYLNGAFRKTLRGDLTMRLYIAVGRQVAWCVRRSALLRSLFRPVFDSALRSSEGR